MHEKPLAFNQTCGMISPLPLSNQPIQTMNIQASDLRPVLKAQAAKDGISEVTILGSAGEADNRITAYQFGDVRVIDTNGDPVWEEQDPEAFGELLQQIEA